MAGYGGRGSRGPRRTGRSSYGKTRRGGKRSTKRSNLGRVGIGLGIVAAGALAVNAAVLGAAGTSRAVKELAGSAKAVGNWAKTRGAVKAARAASTVQFHAKRVQRLSLARKTMAKYRSPFKTKIKVRRWGKR